MNDQEFTKDLNSKVLNSLFVDYSDVLKEY